MRKRTIEVGSFAKLDMARRERTGLGETVYAPGQTPEQLARIFEAFAADGTPCLATRVSPEQAERLAASGLRVRYDATSRTAVSAEAK